MKFSNNLNTFSRSDLVDIFLIGEMISIIMVYILIGLLVLYLLFRLFSFVLGNWKATLNSVLTQYIALKGLKPNFSDKELFFSILDSRYPSNSQSKLRKKLYQDKEEYKEAVEEEIEGGMSVIDKYDLPILIFSCLVIENNSFLRLKRHTCEEDIIEEIKEEIIRQGHDKFVS